MTDTTLGAAEALAILKQQQREIERQMGAVVPPIALAWGVAWLLGFGALWSSGRLGLPLAAAIAAFVALLLAAIAVSAGLGIRGSRGIRSTSQSAFTGTVYGVTWSVGTVAIVLLGLALMRSGMSGELAMVYFTSSYVLFAGVMHIVAGAIWHAVPSVVEGGVLVVVAVAAALVPAPHNLLVIAVVGGGSFFASAVVARRYLRSA